MIQHFTEAWYLSFLSFSTKLINSSLLHCHNNPTIILCTSLSQNWAYLSLCYNVQQLLFVPMYELLLVCWLFFFICHQLHCHKIQYAHRKCVQQWCDEKGDITCEICHQVLLCVFCLHCFIVYDWLNFCLSPYQNQCKTIQP